MPGCHLRSMRSSCGWSNTVPSIEEPMIYAHSGSCYRRRLQMEPRKSLAADVPAKRYVSAFVLEPRGVDCCCRWKLTDGRWQMADGNLAAGCGFCFRRQFKFESGSVGKAKDHICVDPLNLPPLASKPWREADALNVSRAGCPSFSFPLQSTFCPVLYNTVPTLLPGPAP